MTSFLKGQLLPTSVARGHKGKRKLHYKGDYYMYMYVVGLSVESWLEYMYLCLK